MYSVAAAATVMEVKVSPVRSHRGNPPISPTIRCPSLLSPSTRAERILRRMHYIHIQIYIYINTHTRTCLYIDIFTYAYAYTYKTECEMSALNYYYRVKLHFNYFRPGGVNVSCASARRHVNQKSEMESPQLRNSPTPPRRTSAEVTKRK